MSLSKHPFHTEPLSEILAFLLKQLRRPLLAQGFPPSQLNEAVLAQQLMQRDTSLTRLHEALQNVLQESEHQLAQWGMSFSESLETPLGQMSGWETTADFLELATLKSNAELRIASASLLLVWLDAPRYRPYLAFMVAHPHHDELSSIIALRVLQHLDESQASA